MDVLIGLGSNVGDRQATLAAAVEALRRLPQTSVRAVSSWHATAPVGGPAGQQEFLNAAARLDTALEPRALLQHLQQIETSLGRTRDAHWAARTLDLDLLLYGERVMHEPELELPHPRMSYRRFVLAPAVEIAAEMQHPTLGWSLQALWDHLNGPIDYVAITGPLGLGKTALATRLQQHFGGRLLQESVATAEFERYYADPAAQGLATELRLLNQRAAQLDMAYWPTPQADLLVSDFWLAQSIAFASPWLSSDEQAAAAARYQQLLPRVLRPKLLIALDAPAEELLRRIRQRGRSFEQGVTVEQLEKLQAAFAQLLAQPGHGPLLRIDVRQSSPSAEAEAIAAIEALRV